MTRFPTRDGSLRDAGHIPEGGLAHAEASPDATYIAHTSEHMRQRMRSSRLPAYLFYANGYNREMLTIDDINAALRIYGGRQAALASAVGVSQPTVSRWLKGATPDPAQEARLRAILSDSPAPAQSMGGMQQALAFGERDLPVYAAVEGGPGELVISRDAIDFVARPWFLGQVRDGYGVYVVGESMAPAYVPGDMAIVNPRAPQLLHKTYIFCAEPEDGTFTATIKRLVGQSPTHWKVEQFNPPLVFELAKAEWPKAVRVVGKYEV